MLIDVLFVLVTLSCLVVVGVLGLGLGGFGKGRGWAHRNANKLMRYRIASQFVAVIFISLYVYVRSIGGQ